MGAKRIFYKQYVDKRIRARQLIYLAAMLLCFGFILYDSFVNGLPFHYVLFSLLGSILGELLKKTPNVEWSEKEGRIISNRNLFGLLLLIAVISLRKVVFPKILSEMEVVFISDALLLFLLGWLAGRRRLLSGSVEEKVFSLFLQQHSSSG